MNIFIITFAILLLFLFCVIKIEGKGKVVHKAEMWDKMHDAMGLFNDHMLHCSLQFDGELENDVLKSSIKILVGKIPILYSSYHSYLFRAVWVENEKPDLESIYKFFVIEEGKEDFESLSDKFLLDILDETKGEQIRILHLRSYKDNRNSDTTGKGSDSISILMNHMAMDGIDLMRFLKELTEIYNRLLKSDGNEEKIEYDVDSGSRSYDQLFQSMSPSDKARVNRLVSYSKKQNMVCYPFESHAHRGRGGTQYARINRADLPEEAFLKVKSNCKRLGVTVNDAVLGAYYRTVYMDTLGFTVAACVPLGIPVMMDLRRRYMTEAEIQKMGYCNMISMVVVNLEGHVGTTLPETILGCKLNMDTLKQPDHYPGLAGLALLSAVYRFLPVAFAKFLVRTFFKNPLIGISNIGIFDDSKLCFGPHTHPVRAFLTGSIKYPPYTQLALTTLRNRVSFNISNYGTAADHALLARTVQRVVDGLAEFAEMDLSPAVVEETWAKVHAGRAEEKGNRKKK